MARKAAERAAAAQQRAETARREDQRLAGETNAIAAEGNRATFYGVIMAVITAFISRFFTR
jgi:hypothetical protein